MCVYLQNWSHVISYVNKATATPDFSDGNLKNHDHQTLLTRLHCAYGLAELAMRKYKSAAKRFLDANLDYCDIPDLMSTQVHISHELWTKLRKDNENFGRQFNIDHLQSFWFQNVATYGGLCALATFERGELHKQVITSSTFKLFLELDPQLREVKINWYNFCDIRMYYIVLLDKILHQLHFHQFLLQVILSFHDSKYGKCLKLLDEMKDNLLCDLYLAGHVNKLYSMIRNRSLVQYFR